MRRHPIATAALLLFAVISVTAATVTALPSQTRVLEQIQREVENGRIVTLIQEVGPPRWWRPITNAAEVAISAGPGEFTVDTQKLALIELLPDPRRNDYSFQVEVRHNDCHAGASCEVGIYLMHHERNTGQAGKEHLFCALGFNDRVDMAGGFPQHAVPGNPVKLFTQSYLESSPSVRHHVTRLQQYFKPAASGKDTTSWRRLAVSVRAGRAKPAEVEATFDGQRLSWCMQTGNGLRQHEHFYLIEDVLERRGGLGLYVSGGSASFRWAVVEPIIERNN
jgi:hypothetical protein